MTGTRALLVDAFTDEPCAGNAAGVVPAADDLTDDQMRAIAAELGASETAFLRSSDAADRRVRYVTPTEEVDLCGHATVASHAHLYADGVVEAGAHTLETNVGVLDVEVTDDGVVWMTQEPPTVAEADVDSARVADAIGVPERAVADVSADAPIARATTGLPFLLVPVTYLSVLGNADPDAGAVAALADEFDAAGVYAFTFDTVDSGSTLHGRAWVPGVGVPEDPVTGTASGAVGAYLDRFGVLGETPAEMRFEQGHFVDRPGTVRVRVADGDAPRVGGTAVTTLDGTLRVPDAADDGILEA